MKGLGRNGREAHYAQRVGSLLGARAVPTQEVRQAVERAKDLFGRSAMFGGNFWAVLDDVCARHPVSLIAGQR